jgi:hypothetical protein
MGKGGQYQRLLLSIVIALGELGAFLLLGALAVGVITAGIEFLFLLAFAVVALLIGMFPGRGHEFFRTWLTKLAGYLARKVIYSVILVVVLAVCRALDDATSNLGWLLAFTLQAGFLWSVFLQRKRLTADFLGATVGSKADQGGNQRLQALYYTTRLARMAMGAAHRQQTPLAPAGSGEPSPAPNEAPPAGEAPHEGSGPSPSSEPPPSGENPPEGGGSPQPGGEPPSAPTPPSGGGSPSPSETPTHGPGAPRQTPPASEPQPDPGERPPSPAAEPHTAESSPQPDSPPQDPRNTQPATPRADPPHIDTPSPSPWAASSHTPLPPPYSGPLSPVSSTASSGEDALPVSRASLPPASAPSSGSPAVEPSPAQEKSAAPTTAAIPPDDPVALLLAARQSTATTDPANQGDDLE